MSRIRRVHPAVRELAETHAALIDVLGGLAPAGVVLIVEPPRRPAPEPKPEPERPNPERGNRT